MLKHLFLVLTFFILVGLFLASCSTIEEYPLTDEELPIRTTASGVKYVRTPE